MALMVIRMDRREGVELVHYTSARAAVNILKDAFRASFAPMTFDKGMCFFGGAGIVANYPASKECRMDFRWYGRIEETSADRHPSTMDPCILYRSGNWRYIIVPETQTGLEFSGCNIEDKDVIDLRYWIQKPFVSRSKHFRSFMDGNIGSNVSVMK